MWGGSVSGWTYQGLVFTLQVSSTLVIITLQALSLTQSTEQEQEQEQDFYIFKDYSQQGGLGWGPTVVE